MNRMLALHADPLAGIWPDAMGMLQDCPSFEARWLFEKLLEQKPAQVALAGKAMRLSRTVRLMAGCCAALLT